MWLSLARRATAPLLSAVAFTACSDYDFAEQDVSLRLDAAANQIELAIDSRGLYAVPRSFSDAPQPVEEVARDRIRGMAQGERYFHLLTWPFVFDLDSQDRSEGSLAGQPPPEVLAELSEEELALAKFQKIALDSVAVLSASAYLDDQGEAGIHQVVRIKNADAMLAGANELISYAVRDELHKEEARASGGTAPPEPRPFVSPFDSPASRANARAFLDSGRDWFSLTEDALTIHIPMTPEDLAGVMRGMLSDTYSVAMSPDTDSSSLQEGAALGKALTDGLGSLNYDGQVATLRFPATHSAKDTPNPEPKAIHWNLRGPRSRHAKALAASFDEGELKPR